MANHQIGRWCRIPTLNNEIPTLKKGSRQDEPESANAKTRTRTRTRTRTDDDVDDDPHHRSMLHQLKSLASSFGSDSMSVRKIIKNHEVKAFKRTFSDVEWKSCYEVFRGFDRVDFYKTLYEYMQPWKDKVVERKREGKVSLLDSLSMLGLSDQKRRTVFVSFEHMVMELGTQVSQIIVNYLLMFMDRNEEEVEMRGRCNELEATIRCESLEEGGNFFTKKLLCSIKYFLEKIIKEKKGKSVDNVLYEERDRVFLGSIFNMVLLMVIGLFCPFFSFKLENEDIMELGEFLRKFFEEKMSHLNLMFEELIIDSSEEVIEKKEMFIQILDNKIMELWD